MDSQELTDHLSRYQGEYYIIPGKMLRDCVRLMHRLYSEDRMSADDMRDWAHGLDLILLGSDIVPYSE